MSYDLFCTVFPSSHLFSYTLLPFIIISFLLGLYYRGHSNHLAENLEAAEYERDFKLKDDPRITSVGHLLRKSSLDDIPQFYNVLKGEMSLVGPRPIVEKETHYYEDKLSYYLAVKPGITGLWQVSGRNDISYTKRVELNVWYVENWSLWNDIVIFLETIYVVLARKGAY